MKGKPKLLSNTLQVIAFFLFAIYASFLTFTFLLYQDEPLQAMVGYECLIGDETVDHAVHIEVLRHCQLKARSLCRPLFNTVSRNIPSLQALFHVLVFKTRPQLLTHHIQGDQFIRLRIFKI